MEKLSEELYRRFPELREYSGSYLEPLPYLQLGDLARWLDEQARPNIPSELVNRVVAFNQWCLDQPRDDGPSDDIYTFLVVGLYEELVELDNARQIMPKLLSKTEFLTNKQYWISWIGEETYDLVLRIYLDNDE